ncbi:hypothetical protein M7I_5606 [Glarea lozoyensis 74030]|uniref:Uncharacterized protein n=1 Tax=Glarea lozoyensis (strain ATCC 74030 / MF5533) TaxID=1104152 RepID=H0ESC7_GLAL7|nr:hypothetical protein M7I_5606 [Glarea lozoyensis 74030]
MPVQEQPASKQVRIDIQLTHYLKWALRITLPAES